MDSITEDYQDKVNSAGTKKVGYLLFAIICEFRFFFNLCVFGIVCGCLYVAPNSDIFPKLTTKLIKIFPLIFTRVLLYKYLQLLLHIYLLTFRIESVRLVTFSMIGNVTTILLQHKMFYNFLKHSLK